MTAVRKTDQTFGQFGQGDQLSGCVECWALDNENHRPYCSLHKSKTAGRIIAGAIVAAAVLAPSAAHAVQLESADRTVSNVRVTYVEPVGARQLYVELNNGATYRLNPCRVEDGRQCYWDADDMGNGSGSSFVSVSGRLVFSAAIGSAR